MPVAPPQFRVSVARWSGSGAGGGSDVRQSDKLRGRPIQFESYFTVLLNGFTQTYSVHKVKRLS